MSRELIVGSHSIANAIMERPDSIRSIFATGESMNDFFKIYPNLRSKKAGFTLLKNHELQEKSKAFFKEMNLEYKRIPSNMFAVADEIQTYDASWLYDSVKENNGLKILCLDQVTDIHNASAIFRTAAFYNVDIILTTLKNSFRYTPTFYRISSGALEYIKHVKVSSLPKTVSKLKELNVEIYALSEHEESELKTFSESNNRCLILGSEQSGISNALMRIVDNKFSLKSKGKIKSLNVSVAAALAMEKCF